jgi:predicted transcriptional regulator YdeE
MKMRIKALTFLFLITSLFSNGQIEKYNYKREIKGVSDQWHKINLPDAVFGKVSQDLNDIRIFGVTPENDTIEAPYILRIANKKKTSSKEVVFKTLNTSYNENGYYFTFEIPTSEAINKINLDFAQNNYDWRVKLEGSQDQNDWFTIVDSYRVLSIKNGETNFQYSKLTFPSSKYRFFRLLIRSEEKPELTVASITQNEEEDGEYNTYSINDFELVDDRNTKKTEIDIDLQNPVRVSHLNIHINETFDYYRPITIKYLSDSIKTEKGWVYNYRTLTSGTLNSIEKKGFNFNSTTVQKLKIIIHNQSNQPLNINSVELKGEVHELVVRFTEEASYFLAYGNKNARAPSYDIAHFKSKIPKALSKLNLANEVIIEKDKPIAKEPLFKNKAWLWIVMGVIIVMLGWFTIEMIRK